MKRINDQHKKIEKIISFKPIGIKSVIKAEKAGYARELLPAYQNNYMLWQGRSVPGMVMEVIG